MIRTVLAFLLDALLVLVFAVIGRAQHGGALDAAGIWSTWWPFLGGLALGWLAVSAWRRPAALWPQGVLVWAITLTGGMVLRILSGQGTALPFVIVATLVLAALLLGWRTVAALVAREPEERGASAAARAGALSATGSPVAGPDGGADLEQSSLETAADGLELSPDSEAPADEELGTPEGRPLDATGPGADEPDDRSPDRRS
jgi:hypothetical protein